MIGTPLCVPINVPIVYGQDYRVCQCVCVCVCVEHTVIVGKTSFRIINCAFSLSAYLSLWKLVTHQAHTKISPAICIVANLEKRVTRYRNYATLTSSNKCHHDSVSSFNKLMSGGSI